MNNINNSNNSNNSSHGNCDSTTNINTSLKHRKSSSLNALINEFGGYIIIACDMSVSNFEYISCLFNIERKD